MGRKKKYKPTGRPKMREGRALHKKMMIRFNYPTFDKIKELSNKNEQDMSEFIRGIIIKHIEEITQSAA